MQITCFSEEWEIWKGITDLEVQSMWNMPIPDKWTKRPELGTCSREESVFVFGFAMAQGLIEAVVFKKSPGSQERNRKKKNMSIFL